MYTVYATTALLYPSPMSLSRRRLLKNTALTAGLGTIASRFTGVLGASDSASPSATSEVDTTAVITSRERLLADFGWKFALGHANDPVKDFGWGRSTAFAKSGNLISGRNSVTATNFDDSTWKPVDLPHDWAIDLPFSDNRELNEHGAKPLGRAYPETSIGWYRRTFDIPAADNGKRLSLEFDGIFRDAMVILNGHYLGRNLSGYTPFRCDITDFVTYGGKNVLVVRVDATEYEGWFYEGAGIYRHVWLEKTSPLHIAHNGVFVTTTMNPGGSATVKIQTEVMNEQDAEASAALVCELSDADSKPVGHTAAGTGVVTLAGWGKKTLVQTITVAKPKRWSPDAPNLHRLSVQLGSHDAVDVTVGIRTVKFDADKGFFLNGEPLKIKGTCNHHDHAGVGAALPDSLQYFRIKKLKEMGCNAYRTSHNPPTPELLDACDRLGMLVMDETRMMSSSDEGLSQLERMILRDRNHPSVFIWSIGNEEPEQGTDRGARVAATMKRRARQLDPTRLVTQAMNNSWGKGLSPIVDVQGFNYRYQGIDDYHKQFPKQPTIGTEFGSTVSTRGIYENDTVKGYVSAYDRNYPSWASTAEGWWTYFAEREYLTGGFVWTGFDYRGEPTPYNWPCISSHFGILDMCGFPKDLFWYYKAWWGPSSESVLHLFPHWNWPGKEGQEIEVACFTNCETVELFVNGVSHGWQKVARNSQASWKVRYQPGVIEVQGRHASRAGTLIDRRETTGAPAKLVLKADKPSLIGDGEDTIVVACEVQDAQGRVVPTAMNEVQFNVSGPARVIGVGNGDPSSHEPDRSMKRSAFNGLCMVLVQSKGGNDVVTVEAQARGLETASYGVGTTGRPRLRL